MEPVPVVVHPAAPLNPNVATPSAPIPAAAKAPPSGAELLAKAAEERAQMNLDAIELLNKETRRSATLGKLGAALSKVQARLESAKRDAKNPFYKSSYASLASVTEAWRAAKPDEVGLSVIQLPSGRGRLVVLTTMLLHESDEWIEERLVLIAQDDKPQSVASATTYARRIAFSAVTGVAQDDDDGEAAQREAPPAGVNWDKGKTDLQHSASEPQAQMPGVQPAVAPTPPPPAASSTPSEQVASEKVAAPVGRATTSSVAPAQPTGVRAGTPVPPPAGRPPTAGAPLRPTFAPPQPPQQTAANTGGVVVGPPPPGMKPPTRAPGR